MLGACVLLLNLAVCSSAMAVDCLLDMGQQSIVDAEALLHDLHDLYRWTSCSRMWHTTRGRLKWPCRRVRPGSRLCSNCMLSLLTKQSMLPILMTCRPR